MSPITQRWPSTISAGTLQIGNGGTSGSNVGNVIDNGNLEFSRSDSITFGGVISGLPGSGAIVSDWLITPVLLLEKGATMSFHTQASPNNTQFPNVPLTPPKGPVLPAADPTVFTRTVSGNWTDTTGWTPSGVPNGNTVTAQLVNPGSGKNSVDLGGGTFTLNQLRFFGTGAGTWDVVHGTIVFDGTNPMFVNQGGSSGLVGTLPSLQLNASTTFEIDNASAVTEATGTISGTGGLTKTGSGALVLIGVNVKVTIARS